MKRLFTNSELATYQQCPKKWWFKYHEMLDSTAPKLALIFGTIMHKALNAYYTNYPSFSRDKMKEIIENIQKEYTVLSENFHQDIAICEKLIEQNVLAKNILNRYEIFAKQNDKFRIIFIERAFDIDLNGFIYRFQPDLVVEDDKYMYIVEHKTAKDINNLYLSNLMLDNQIDRYLFALSIITSTKYKKPLRGVIYNVMRKKAPAIPALLKNGCLSKNANIDTDYETYLQTIRDNKFEVKDYKDILDKLSGKDTLFFYREYILRNKTELQGTKNDLETLFEMLSKSPPIYKCPTQDCSWKCSYRPLCIEDTKTIREEAFVKRTFYHSEYKTGKEV